MVIFQRIQALYEGDSKAAHRFRCMLLGFDLPTITFIIVTSFFERSGGGRIDTGLVARDRFKEFRD